MWPWVALAGSLQILVNPAKAFMRPKNVLLTLFAFCVLEPSPSFGQSVSVGIVAGAGLTGDFCNTYDPASPQGPGETDFSTPKRYLVGPMLEFGLPAHFSLEVDGLFRPLEFTWGPESAAAFEAGNLNRLEFLTGFSF
jgi:hypothetical protein